ncbi:MAG: hypothetical protein KH921_14385 [Erysipelotrichaceae bacterium]|nr:hypothetical protein [Erysipelotrichaceae bacterium]
MSRSKYDPELNIEREIIIMKIYLTLTDVRNFMHCNWKEAKEKFDKAHELCIQNGKINREGHVYYKYFLDVVSMNETDIHRMAKIERSIKKDAP